MQAYFKATKPIENVLGPEQAKTVIEALNFSISAIENKCEEQRPILKAEIKDEMSKELASKADLNCKSYFQHLFKMLIKLPK